MREWWLHRGRRAEIERERVAPPEDEDSARYWLPDKRPPFTRAPEANDELEAEEARLLHFSREYEARIGYTSATKVDKCVVAAEPKLAPLNPKTWLRASSRIQRGRESRRRVGRGEIGRDRVECASDNAVGPPWILIVRKRWGGPQYSPSACSSNEP